ncbi:ABC transporter ATP-binding protein [Planomonospora parontospora subsp. parontospora]|uniref:Nuclease SbcCD subunit C n=2 Tax=Planomonospora parontospora TaxID=58119 RepID=A0AA37F1K4_9ACTN|nr:AAA family ATPase [Planomonospora parontospora]GGK44965.1 ABC transporter ATP-binding protein [Planomonospora parontospora]GII06266.1 ABC transporter ATP-binding protein [Planomonospora parontospora subsp. parontospora]
MKLLKLTLNNFRTFYGQQVLDLRVDDDKPAILIFGTNGAGKTTLLNAFTWALYGAYSHDVEQQQRVIHDRAWTDAPFGTPVSASVKLEFEHEGTVFSVLREVAVVKDSSEQSLVSARLVVTEIRHGESVKVENGQDRIEKILPEGLRRFFFFNGERMEKMFTDNENNSEVKQAIKTLLGLESIERAIADHLPAAVKRLGRDISKEGGGRLKALHDEKESLEKKQMAAHDEALKLSSDISSYQAEVDAAERALRANSETAPMQKERQEIGKRIDLELQKLQERQNRKRDLISKSGFLAFTGGIDETVIALAEGMRRRRELPAGIQRDFIDALLDEGVCMCGTPVSVGTPAYDELEKRRYNAGLADVESRWMYVSGQVKHLCDERHNLSEQLKEVTQDIQEIESAITRLDEQKSEIDRKLEGVDILDVQRLERRRKEFDDKRIDALAAHRRKQEEIAEIDKSIETVKRRFHSAEVQDEASRRVQRQIRLVNEVLDSFRKILELKTDEVRRQLDAKIKEVFSRIFFKTYTPELTDGFELLLKQSDAGDAIRSTGENQVLGLSFVGAVSEVAKQMHDRKAKGDKESLTEGGIYPVVMDAPFGSLDLTYQGKVSGALPRLTSQIVTLLSQSQSRGKVMENLQGAATRLYVLRAVTPNRDAAEETIEINHRAVPYVVHGEFEHTVLEEVAI